MGDPAISPPKFGRYPHNLLEALSMGSTSAPKGKIPDVGLTEVYGCENPTVESVLTPYISLGLDGVLYLKLT